jgi:hypothetical protein
MRRRVPLGVAMVLAVTGMLAISGCGVRGSLDAPPGATTNTTGSSTPGTPGSAEPHRPSILDPLIR